MLIKFVLMPKKLCVGLFSNLIWEAANKNCKFHVFIQDGELILRIMAIIDVFGKQYVIYNNKETSK